MAATTRLSLALHAMAILAARSPSTVQSSDLAATLKIHPVALRRLLGQLAHSGLVKATRGRAGGFAIARAPSKVTLREVYEAVDPDFTAFALHHPGAEMSAALQNVFAKIDVVIASELSRTTVATLARRGAHHGPRAARRS